MTCVEEYWWVWWSTVAGLWGQPLVWAEVTMVVLRHQCSEFRVSATHPVHSAHSSFILTHCTLYIETVHLQTVFVFTAARLNNEQQWTVFKQLNRAFQLMYWTISAWPKVVVTLWTKENNKIGFHDTFTSWDARPINQEKGDVKKLRRS